MYSFTVPENQVSKVSLTRLKSKCQQSWFLLVAPERRIHSCGFQMLLAFLGLWPYHFNLCFCCYISFSSNPDYFCFSLIRIIVITSGLPEQSRIISLKILNLIKPVNQFFHIRQQGLKGLGCGHIWEADHIYLDILIRNHPGKLFPNLKAVKIVTYGYCQIGLPLKKVPSVN